MCGIFGLIRNTEASHPERASAAFVELGKHAVERGSDSAGFALTSPTSRPTVTGATYAHANARQVVLDHVHIIKDTVPFGDLWDDDQHLPLLAANRVAIGHTRWATQGKRDALTNASPLLAGNLVGTHNGDIDTASVEGKWGLPQRNGTTDTEILYLALNRDRRDRRKITKTLSKIEGRAALAWVDRNRPDRVYLARAALSPLAIAWDAEGNLYWASNPRWFRDIDVQFNGALGFHDILIVAEGTLLTVNLDGPAPDIEDSRRFTPLCRPSDSRLSDAVVWRGFLPADCAADKAQTRHKVARSRYSYSGFGGSSSKTRKTGFSGGWGWDSAGGGFDSLPASQSTSMLPAYNDRLDAIADQAYADTMSDAADEQEAFNEDDFDYEDEAMIAANRWVDEGADQTILGALRTASMPSEIEALMDEFDLSSERAFKAFRNIVEEWSTEALT